MSEPQKKHGFAVRMAVLSIIIAEYTITITTPALGAISAAMPDVSPELIKQVQSLPNLFMMFVALLVPFILRFIKKKPLLIIALFLLLIGGVAPAFGGGIYFILVCRAIFGMGRGVVFPFAMSFIVELFEGKDRENMMGFRSTTANICGIIFQQLGGILATIFWRYAFWGVLLIIPFILLIMFKLPEPPETPKAAPLQAAAPKQSFTSLVWIRIIFNMVLMFFAYSFMTNMAIVIAQLGLGTPQMTGNVMSTFTAASAVTGLLLGSVFRPLFKRFSVTVGVLFLAGGILVLSWAPSLGFYFLGAALFGIGFCSYNGSIYLDLTMASPRQASQIISVHMGFNAFAQFASPIVLAFIAGILGLTGPLAGWTIAGPALLVLCVLYGVFSVFQKTPATAVEAAKAAEATE